MDQVAGPAWLTTREIARGCRRRRLAAAPRPTSPSTRGSHDRCRASARLGALARARRPARSPPMGSPIGSSSPTASAGITCSRRPGTDTLNLELAGSLLAALVVVGFAGCVLAGTRRRDAPPLWIFALAPPLGFALQEHAELVLHYHAFERSPIFTPVFLVGLGLQIRSLSWRSSLRGPSRSRGAGERPAAAVRLAPDASLELAVSDWRPAAPTLLGARGQRAPPVALAL